MARKNKKTSYRFFQWLILGFGFFLLSVFLLTVFLFSRPDIFHYICHRISFFSITRKTHAVHAPDGFSIHGIDVSHYQGVIDWERVAGMKIKGTPLAFVYMRATMGADRKDKRFSAYRSEVRRTEMRFGAYHFFYHFTDPESQARHFLDVIKPYSETDLPPVLDVEGYVSRPDSLCDRMQRWLDIVQKETKKRPIIYTNYKLYRQYFRKRFRNYTFWIAHYNISFTPALQDPSVLFWQHQEEGKIPGIEEDVDLNVFSGSDEQFLEL